MKQIAFLCLLFLYLFSDSFAQISLGDASLSGRVYSDYYWMAHHHNEDIEGKNGFWFRRIYATYDRDMAGSFSTRLRFEMNSAGDFHSNTEMTPEVKDAYLKWQHKHHQIIAGISESPTFALTEEVWGYRSVEKSPQDLYDFGSSRDFGIAFQGTLTGAGGLHYHLFIGNGNNNKPEVDKGKKVSLSLAYNLTETMVVEGYGDYNSRTNNPDRYTAQLFGGYQSETLNIGVLYSAQYREDQPGLPSQTLDLVSAFTNIKISDMARGYLRADHLFDGYAGGSDNSYIPFAEGVESTFLVGGADLLLADQIHLMPNIEAIVYGENSQEDTPDTDIIPRLTLFYEF